MRTLLAALAFLLGTFFCGTLVIVARLLGGSGDDFVDGQQGADVAFLGADAVPFRWDPGDGSDDV